MQIEFKHQQCYNNKRFLIRITKIIIQNKLAWSTEFNEM